MIPPRRARRTTNANVPCRQPTEQPSRHRDRASARRRDRRCRLLRALGKPVNPGGRGRQGVSDVVDVPDGPLLMVDGGLTPGRLLRQIPDIVARRLEQAGVSAVVRWPRADGVLERVYRAPRAVFLRLCQRRPTRKGSRIVMTPRWLQDASRWAVGALDDGDAMCSLQAVEFTARAGDVGSLLDGWERDRPGYAVICTGDPAASIDGVAVNLPATDFLELALFTGGPQVDDERLVRAIDELRQIARQLAPMVAYAFISVEP